MAGLGLIGPPAPSATPDPCAAGDPPVALNLATFWLDGAARDPGFRASALRLQAGDRSVSALRRERLPAFGVEGLSNYGQRVSPGEERVLGVGGRSELRMLATWTLFDGTRSHRIEGMRLETQALSAEASAQSAHWKEDQGRAFAEALHAEAQLSAVSEHLRVLEALLDPVRRRVSAGVESEFEARVLFDALAGTNRRLEAAEEARNVHRADLSLQVGRCVRPVAAGLDAALQADDEDSLAAQLIREQGSPEVVALLFRADALHVRSRALSSTQGWQVALTGIVGPTRSRAFSPDRVESESLVGVFASIRLDPAGVGRLRAQAGEAEALALRAEAEHRALSLERERTRVTYELGGIQARVEQMRAEWREGLRALESATLRWNAGVGGWATVVQAAEQSLARQLLLLDGERDMTLLQLRKLNLFFDSAPLDRATH